jgi:hypothetical protein
MDRLIATELAVPVGQLLLFAALSVLCLLWGRFKIGMAVTFCFTFYWAFIYNRDVVYQSVSGTPLLVVLYFLTGIVLLLCVLGALSLQD